LSSITHRRRKSNTIESLTAAIMKKRSPIQGAVVGHYFTLYDGASKQKYQNVVAAAPFEKCNLLILAFVATFTIDRSSDEGGPIHVVQVANGRDPGTFPINPHDTDGDRIKLIVETARKKNPSISILISLGYNNQDVGKAASAPVAFADSVRTLVQAYDLNGFDIDFENTDVKTSAMVRLAQEIRRSLNKIPSRRPVIMTITPANDGRKLNKNVLEQFTYIMPQTYFHGGDGTDFTDATWYAKQLGSYERIVYGLNSEGFLDRPGEDGPDDPKRSADEAKKNHAAGIFAWRLNGDSIKQGFPTFADAVKMWKLMN
jgi:Glycosyl hydrolases family 18